MTKHIVINPEPRVASSNVGHEETRESSGVKNTEITDATHVQVTAAASGGRVSMTRWGWPISGKCPSAHDYDILQENA